MSAEQKATKQDERARFEGCRCAAFMKELMAQRKGWDCTQMMSAMMEMCHQAPGEKPTTDQKETA